MSTGAIIFMAMSWTFVLGLMTWSFTRIMRVQRTPTSGDSKSTDNRGG